MAAITTMDHDQFEDMFIKFFKIISHHFDELQQGEVTVNTTEIQYVFVPLTEYNAWGDKVSGSIDKLIGVGVLEEECTMTGRDIINSYSQFPIKTKGAQ